MSFCDFPLTLVWDITYKCNLKCKHCYINDGKMRTELSSKRLLELVYELADCGLFYLDIGGGEPLLRKNDLFKLINIASHAHIECTMSTNGWYLSSKTVRDLKEKGLKRILVSLDGATKDTHDKFRNRSGAFQRAVDGLRNCVKLEIETYSIFTLTKFNINEVENVINLTEKMGCDGIIIAKFVPFGQGNLHRKELMVTKEEYRICLDRIRKLKTRLKIDIKEDCGPTNSNPQDMCHAGKFVGAIRPNGDVVPCAFFPIIVGNVSNQAFKEIWSKSRVINSLKSENYISMLDGCESCAKLHTCKGGCKGRSQAFYGTWLKKDPLCIYY